MRKLVFLLCFLSIFIPTFTTLATERFNTDYWENITLQQTKEAIRNGKDVNTKDIMEWTPLMHAARTNPNPEVIEFLIKHGANIAERDDEGSTALMHAMNNKNLEIIKTLIKHGANVQERNKFGTTLLISAAGLNENPEVIKLLIKYGLDVNAKDNDGETALMHAALYNKNLEIIKILIKNGADVSAKNKFGVTALHHAKHTYFKHNPEIYQLLKE